jgi:hypothetical protein
MLDAPARSLLAATGALADRLGGGRVAEHPRHYLEILALFDRCRGMFGAVRLLADDRFAHEALILTRPLFTESLMLQELASVGEARRVELVTGWRLASLASLEGVLLEARSRGDDVTQELGVVATQRTALEAYARRHNAGTRQWRVDEKALANKHRGGDGYLDFRMAHHFVHGTSFASDQRYSARGDLTLVGGPAAESGWDKAAALSAAQSMLFAVRGICAVVGWAEPPEVQRLLAEVENVGGRGDEAAVDTLRETRVAAREPRSSTESITTPESSSEPPEAQSLTLKWGDLHGLPLLFANQLLCQSRPGEGAIYIAFGHVTAPPFLGSADEIRQQAEGLDALEIQPIARLAVTPDAMRAFIRALRDSLEKYEEGRVQVDRTRAD